MAFLVVILKTCLLFFHTKFLVPPEMKGWGPYGFKKEYENSKKSRFFRFFIHFK